MLVYGEKKNGSPIASKLCSNINSYQKSTDSTAATTDNKIKDIPTYHKQTDPECRIIEEDNLRKQLKQ